jgi:hypothetical protein
MQNCMVYQTLHAKIALDRDNDPCDTALVNNGGRPMANHRERGSIPHAIPPGKDDHMLTVDGIPACSPAGHALVNRRTEEFCKAMQEEVTKGRIMRGVD